MRAIVRTGRLLLGLGWEIGPVVFVLYIAVSITAFLSPLLLAFGLRPLIDGIVGHHPGSVRIGAVLTGAALLLSVAAPAGYRWTTIRLREISIMVMQRRLLRLATDAVGLDHFENPEFWDRLQLLKRSSFDLVMGMTFAVVAPIIAVQMLVMAVVLSRFHPFLFALPLVAVPAAMVSQRAERIKREGEQRVAADRRAAHHLFSLASSAVSAKEIRLYGLRSELLERHTAFSARVHQGMERSLFLSVLVSATGWLLFAAAYVVAMLIVLGQAGHGRVSAGDVALTLAMATSLVAAAGRFSELAGNGLRSVTAAGHYYWLEAQGRPAGEHAAAPPATLRDGIEFDGVTFTYGQNERPALDQVSMRLPAGAVVAVVGENGAGKTTLVKLLSAMYRPASGRVLLDGVDLATIDVDAYRNRITAGFQDFMRFELLTRETVGIGDLPRLDDVDGVREALAKVNASFAESLPQGVDTPLGRSWTGGVDLSGGEWQKLALARSLLRLEPFLVILDEPTASLDPQTEHALFEQVAADSRRHRDEGRITVLISHRFSTVRMADLIVVLDHGRVIEQGTHAELVAAGGLYAELYQLQAAAYR